MHLGGKAGKITFKDEENEVEEVFNVKINTRPKVAERNSEEGNKIGNQQDLEVKVEKEDEFAIFQDSFEVESVIRKGKVFAISLQNKSDR